MRKYITKASERIGVESTSRDGKRAQVVSYSTCENFIIRFCDGKEMKLKNWRYFIEGNFNYEKYNLYLEANFSMYLEYMKFGLCLVVTNIRINRKSPLKKEFSPLSKGKSKN